MGFDTNKINQLEKHSFFGYFVDAVKNHYVDFNGRARRKAFGFFTLVDIIISIILAIIDNIVFVNIIGIPLLGAIFILAILLPSIAISVRRLHDIGQSGWFALLWLVPIVDLVLLIVLLAADGERGENKYGANPKGE
ncbi:MAG: DUF805 domain-containing protein [Campylobacteraceae bacterium]|jgi:uncharacterized membrane protein YhaH (DUF805 family)|nr:DUF805 domain-containing protein [Campylobacteraceae bacterium]